MTITIPLFSITITIPKIACTILGIPIYWYGIIIAIAMAVAVILYRKKSGTYGISFDTILSAFLWVIPFAFLGARLYCVIFRWDYYSSNPNQILQIKNGGLAIYGGLFVGVAILCFYCKKNKICIRDMLDYVVPEIALAQSIGRWGNFFNVEAYGVETTLPWKMGIEAQGTNLYVHPTFLYESICTLGIYLLLHKIEKNRKWKGQITCLYITLYSFARMWIEGLRTESLYLGNIRISQLVSIILFVVFGSILFYFAYRNRKMSEKEEKNKKVTYKNA